MHPIKYHLLTETNRQQNILKQVNLEKGHYPVLVIFFYLGSQHWKGLVTIIQKIWSRFSSQNDQTI